MVDAETKEVWLLSCRNGQVRLQPVNIPSQATLTAYRSTKALKMTDDGAEELTIGSR